MEKRSPIDVRKLTVNKYRRLIHGMPWEEFVKAVVKRQGSNYALKLYEKAVEVKAEVIMELGVMVGESTRALLKAASENGGHLYSVELSDNNLMLVGKAFKEGGIDDSRWTPLCGDDLDVAEIWCDLVDFLFIDAQHTYDHVLSELEAYWDFVTWDGVIVLHDTWGKPVMRAVEEWMSRHVEWEFEDITPPFDGWGLGLLRRRKEELLS